MEKIKSVLFLCLSIIAFPLPAFADEGGFLSLGKKVDNTVMQKGLIKIREYKGRHWPYFEINGDLFRLETKDAEVREFLNKCEEGEVRYLRGEYTYSMRRSGVAPTVDVKLKAYPPRPATFRFTQLSQLKNMLILIKNPPGKSGVTLLY